MKITAFLPVYSEPKRVASIVRALSSEEYPDSQTVVVVDGPETPAIAGALEPVRTLPGVRVITGMPHLGKAEALNRAVASTDSEIILFLDNDVVVPPGTRLFRTCAEALENADFMELPKAGAGKGPVAAMVKLEFILNVTATAIVVSKLGRIPAMNGAAFTVRRTLFEELGGFGAVVNEDMDFAARAFLARARFAFEPGALVYNDVPETIPQWLGQRKRWSVSQGMWAKSYVSRASEDAGDGSPVLVTGALLFTLPFFSTLIAVLAMALSPGMAGGGIWGFVPAAAGVLLFSTSASLFSDSAARFGIPFPWLAYIPFALLYSPVWLLSNIHGHMRVQWLGIPRLDWKYGSAEGERHTGAPAAGRRSPAVSPGKGGRRRRAIGRNG